MPADCRVIAPYSVGQFHDAIRFEQHTDAITARVMNELVESTVRVRWLVGADGGRSFVRRALGIDFPGKTLGVRAIVADVQLTGLQRDAWHRFGDGDTARQIAIAPLAGTDMFQIQAPVPFGGEVDLSAAGLNALLAARTATTLSFGRCHGHLCT